MKATGIVRRIDDLGRIIIPKEIRRMLRIKENDPLEIFMERDTVIFKKYHATDMLDLSMLTDFLEASAGELSAEDTEYIEETVRKLDIIKKKIEEGE